MVGTDWLHGLPELEDTCYVNEALSCFGVQRQTVQTCSGVLQLGCRFFWWWAWVVVAMLKNRTDALSALNTC